MAQTKATSARYNGSGSIFASSGYKGVSRRGSKWGWQYNSSTGYFSKGGFDSPEEAAYAYDEFLTAHTAGNADTNQALGLLKPKQVLAIREKLLAAEKPQRKQSRARGKIGFKGVSSAKSKTKPFTANISIKGKIVYIGSFPTAEEAARAYDSYALRYIGVDAETNVTLGLLPPLEEPKFIPNLLKKPRASGPITADTLSANDCSSSSIIEMPRELTPEQERERQIEAARIMAEQEAAEEASEVNQTPPPVETTAASNEPLITGEEKQTITFNTVKVEEKQTDTSDQFETKSGEHIPAVITDPSTLYEQAAALMQRAREAERRQAMNTVTQIVIGLAESVKGYQQAVSDLVDYGAELESQLSKLQTLLSGK